MFKKEGHSHNRIMSSDKKEPNDMIGKENAMHNLCLGGGLQYQAVKSLPWLIKGVGIV